MPERAAGKSAHPPRMPQAYDGRDYLQPNDSGMQAMANAIPLDLFRAARRR